MNKKGIPKEALQRIVIMESSRVQDIKAFYVMEILERAHELERQGVDVVHLEVGEPDFDTPDPVKEAVAKAMCDGHTHYTHSLGLLELREAICGHYHKKYGVAVDPGQVVVTNGTSPAMLMVFHALLEAGDQIIVSNPHYACYPTFIRLACGEPVLVDVQEEDGFQYRSQAIKKAITPRTKGIFINSPANPTGTLLPPERMQRIADLGPAVISDEIYHGLVYEGAENSILEFTDNAFVLNGFSKAYAMTGLRLGYCIAPKSCMRGMQKLSQNLFICANAAVQWGGVVALTQCDDYVEKMRGIYNERRKFMIRRLREIGLGISVEPTGAFYVFANAKELCRGLGRNSYDLAFDILEKAGVGVTPGTDFGAGGEGYIRFSYANSLENIERGMDRLEQYVKSCGV